MTGADLFGVQHIAKTEGDKLELLCGVTIKHANIFDLFSMAHLCCRCEAAYLADMRGEGNNDGTTTDID